MRSATRRRFLCAAFCLPCLMLVVQNAKLLGQAPPPPPPPPPNVIVMDVPLVVPANAPKDDKKTEGIVPGAMEVRFGDGSILKVLLKDEKLECETAHGKLLIPVGDVLKVDMAVRSSAEVRKRVDMAIADLGHAEPKRREAAAAELLALKEKAYPALLLAAKVKDTEAGKSAEQVLDKLRARVPAETLEMSQFDVIHTRHSRIAGRLKSETLRVATFAFGEQQMKLGDVRSLRSQAMIGNETLRTPIEPFAPHYTAPPMQTPPPPVVAPPR